MHLQKSVDEEGNLCKGIVAFMLVGLKQSAEAATRSVLSEKVFLEILKIHKKTPVPEPYQGCSQNLKKVPQNFTEVFYIDDVITNDVIRRKQHRKEKNKLELRRNH